MSEQQSDLLVVTNPAPRSCDLVTAPRITLYLAGQPLVDVTAAPGGTTTALPAGASARALVHGPTTCDAPVSDTARVVLGGDGYFVDVALQMRACQLTVDQFTTG